MCIRDRFKVARCVSGRQRKAPPKIRWIEPLSVRLDREWEDSKLNTSSNAKSHVVHGKNFSVVQGPRTRAGDQEQLNLDQELLRLISTGSAEDKTLLSFSQLILLTAKPLGVSFVERTPEDVWQLLPEVSYGKFPDPVTLVSEWGEACEAASHQSGMYTEPGKTVDGLPGVFFSLATDETATPDSPVLMLVVFDPRADASSAMRAVQTVAQGILLWKRQRSATQSKWEADSLSAIIELSNHIEQQPDLEKAGEELTNALATHTKCHQVALGVCRGTRLSVVAVSGSSKFDRRSKTVQHYQQAMVESLTRKTPASYPVANDEDDFMVAAHRQLNAHLQSETVYSLPLFADDKSLGVLIFAGERNQLAEEKFHRFSNAMTPAIIGSLCVVQRIQQTAWRRTFTRFGRIFPTRFRWYCLAATLVLAMLLMLPVTYRVRCDCVAEPVSRRFAVSPFDGLIVTGYVEPGDSVTKGQLLAELEGRHLNWELASVDAELQQAVRTREIELADRNISKTMLAELQQERLTAQREIIVDKLDHLSVKSPIDGVVLSGSLERAEAASVTTGQVLFEIGPVSPLKLEIAIPADDISKVKVEMPATIWIHGQEEQAISGRVQRIHPRSEIRDAKNVFIAEMEFENENQEVRPGMKGTVRIDGESHSLGWTLFHKPINFARSRLTWW